MHIYIIYCKKFGNNNDALYGAWSGNPPGGALGQILKS